eukprot:TRINITY_DN45427_c0_g1_i1.p1 TRINITY_DN45427_c0_g1~~TRINITY_DN45427_c0_g1_i1.p1  ORF type:complete len:214 (+),score=52.19 TRINITY_DN45427_c0_g1_i1:73-714(+)
MSGGGIADRLESEEAENKRLRRLVELQEENRRLRQMLSNDSGESPSAPSGVQRPTPKPAPRQQPRPGAGDLPDLPEPPPDFSGLMQAMGQRGRLSKKMVTAMEDLDRRHREIMSRKKQIDSLSDDERRQLAADFQEWQRDSQEVMMMVTFTQLQGRQRKRRQGQRLLVFAAAVVVVAVVIAVAARYLFLRPAIRGDTIVRGGAEPLQEGELVG